MFPQDEQDPVSLRLLDALEESSSLPGDGFQVAGASRQLAGVEPQAAAAVGRFLAGPGLDAWAGVRVPVELPIALQEMAQPWAPAAERLWRDTPGLPGEVLITTAPGRLGHGLAGGPGAGGDLFHHLPCTVQGMAAI